MSDRRIPVAALMALGAVLSSSPADAIGLGGLELPRLNLGGSRIEGHADAVLTLMAFTVLPDVTTSSLTIGNRQSDDPNLTQETIGGGFTLERWPLYLEGTLGWSNYDPSFVATQGTSAQRVPSRWRAASASGGLGWDFPLAWDGELVLRPILNFTLGRLESDSRAPLLEGEELANTDRDLDFLREGRMNAYGLGGSLMLDYRRWRTDYEVDAELRFTHINLSSFDTSLERVRGRSHAESLSLWTRWRAPTGAQVLERPLRYVLELSSTAFFGPQRAALGFDYLTSVGAGLEIDLGAYPLGLTRARLMYRYLFGENLAGYSIGLGLSF